MRRYFDLGCVSTESQFRKILLFFHIVILFKDFLKREWQAHESIPATIIPYNALYPRATLAPADTGGKID